MSANSRNSVSCQEGPIAFRDGFAVSRERLWGQVRALAAALPDRPHVFNLCEDRYLFLLTLLAAVQRRQICLLPPSGQAGVLTEILGEYPDAYAATDTDAVETPCTRVRIIVPKAKPLASRPDFELARTAVIAFTSGSTGTPARCPHTLGTFFRSAAMALASLEIGETPLLLISTTPPQHMYGLETSIFWPLCSQLVLHPGRPFFPEDMRRLVAETSLPVLLVSTPTHLRALAAAGGNWSNLAGIISSTAPLPAHLAQDLELQTGAMVREIFGSTETLSFARRQTARENLWLPYGGAALEQEQGGQTWLHSEHLPAKAELLDIFEIEADGRFSVLGRSADMIKIAGKRISLAEMNRRLTAIKGVEDGLFQVFEDGAGGLRTVAIVVSELDRQAIRSALSAFLDEVFLPRRVHYVDAIPRNEIGKVRKADLDRLLAGR